MKHSNKIIMIPQNAFDNFMRQQNQLTPPTVKKMAQLDDEMKLILERTDTTQEEKAKLYSQTLENYLHFKTKRTDERAEPIPVKLSEVPKKAAVVNSTDPINNAVNDKDKMTVGEIVEVLPKTLQPKAKMILRRIRDNPAVLSWTDRGELKYNGETLANTNITNLVGDSLKYRKNNKPKGYEIFTKGLSEINLPEDLIRNPERLQLFKTHVYEKTPDKEKDSPEKEEYTPVKRRARKLQWKTNF
jgi:hypothetical protein